MTSERMIQPYQIDTSYWAFKLVPLLTGEVCEISTALGLEGAKSYAAVWVAILYMNEETYRESLKLKMGETPEKYGDLNDLAIK